MSRHGGAPRDHGRVSAPSSGRRARVKVTRRDGLDEGNTRTSMIAFTRCINLKAILLPESSAPNIPPHALVAILGNKLLRLGHMLSLPAAASSGAPPGTTLSLSSAYPLPVNVGTDGCPGSANVPVTPRDPKQCAAPVAESRGRANISAAIPKAECERVMADVRAYCRSQEPLGDLDLVSDVRTNHAIPSADPLFAPPYSGVVRLHVRPDVLGHPVRHPFVGVLPLPLRRSVPAHLP